MDSGTFPDTGNANILPVSLQGDCSMREYQFKELCAMHSSAFLQFEHFADCSIREYQSILV